MDVVDQRNVGYLYSNIGGGGGGHVHVHVHLFEALVIEKTQIN